VICRKHDWHDRVHKWTDHFHRLERLSINMKMILVALISTTILFSPIFATESSDLELIAHIETSVSGESELWLEITNRGNSEQTVLTEKFTLRSFGMSFNGRLLPSVDLRFLILKLSTVGNPDEKQFIPSLPTLAPVTLKKGETAKAVVKLSKEFIAALEDNLDREFKIRYAINEDIAQRFSLWHGTLETNVTGRSLLSK
jgi:hypothetical protein